MPKPKLVLGNLQQRANEEFTADKSYEKEVSQNLGVAELQDELLDHKKSQILVRRTFC